MKTRFPPLALGAAFLLCLAVLVFAVRTFSAHEQPRLPDAEEARATAGGTNPPSVKPASAGPGELGAESTEGAARVALAGETPVLALPQAEYEVRSSSDRPLSGARAVLHRGEEVFDSKLCDAAGVVRFDAGEGLAELIVVSSEVAVVAVAVPRQAGHHVVVLERGYAVSGRVRLAGQGSARSVELELISDRPMVDDTSWPLEVRQALALRDREKLRLKLHADEAGNFEFSGLTMPWSGRLEVGEAHELTAVSAGAWSTDSNSVRLDDPIEGLLLDVSALPLATGIVVTSPGGPGVARASVEGTLSFEPGLDADEGGTAGFSGRAGEDGRFALPIQRRDNMPEGDWAGPQAHFVLRKAVLTIDGGDNVPRRRLELSGAQLPSPFDFGELVLARGSTLHFVALDSGGAALPGAVGRLDGERSEPTDEHGRATIAYAPGGGRPLSVSLAGYRDGRADVPAEVSDALSVKLERTTRLTVIVRDAAGAPAEGLSVDVRAPSTSQPGGNRRRESRPREQRTDAEGKAEFSDLPSSVVLRARVRDAAGAMLAEQQTTLAAEQWSTLEIAIPRALLFFRGIVRDEQGLALAEANVELLQGPVNAQSRISQRSDSDGKFSFSGLSQAAGQLRVRKTGFASLTVTDFQIPPPDTVVELRLERGLRLTLRIVDERGAPVRGDNMRLELDGERSWGQRQADNEWAFANLARVQMLAIGNVGGREYRREIEPLNGNQEFRVPQQGGLEVTLRLDPAKLQSQLRMGLRANDNRRVYLERTVTQDPLQTRTFAPLLPGEYQLTVSELVKDGQKTDWITLGASQRVRIEAGGNQRIEIER